MEVITIYNLKSNFKLLINNGFVMYLLIIHYLDYGI